MRYSFLYAYLNGFLFFYNLFAFTSCTFSTLSNDLSLSLALITCFLHLLIHARPHLIHLHNSSLSFAGFTFLNILASLPLAGFTASCSLMLYFCHFSIIYLLEGYIEWFFSGLNLLHLFGPSSSHSPTPKKGIEQI